MSTPSTAIATSNPPPHLHYGFPHRQNYPPHSSAGSNTTTTPSSRHPNNTLLNASSARLTNSHHPQYTTFSTSTVPAIANHSAAPAPAAPAPAAASATMPPRRPAAAARQPPPPQSSVTHTHSSSSSHRGSNKRQRTPDWGEFYKNGLPREVIVIDDDDEDDDEETHEEGTGQRPDAVSSDRNPPSGARPNHTTRTVAGLENPRHADKKRKTAASTTYDPVYHHSQQNGAYSTTTTPHHHGSPSVTTGSSDRTTSALQSTATTSLGSHYSQSATVNGNHDDDDEVVGKKRKRTRKAAADEAKKREIEAKGDAFSNYFPPPKPPIKAKEVYVAVVQDSPYMKHQKVDDDDGHYIVTQDADLTDRYQVTRLLGQGTFGKVVEAYDRRKRTKCAIKIIRSVPKYRDASRIELRVLSTLASNDKENRNKCIHLRDCFDYRNHICIVTDLLGQSVFDFLKSNQFVPFPNSQIQNFARQLLTSVAYLKPENILLVENAYQTFTYNRQIPSSSTTTSRSARHRKVLLDTEIRLIDFGSATFDDEYHSSVVSTRHYRAPEIILGLGWSFPCDIWSIGCILVEFFTGDALFQTHDNLEHLAMMESVCGGKIEPKLIRQVTQSNRNHGGNPAAKYFLRGHRLDYPNQETSKASKKYVKAMKRLHEIIPSNNAFNRQFLDLLRRIFLYDPKARITAKEALKHPWFTETIMDDGSEATRIKRERERAGRGY
ncbi:MAG: hypothetical protein M4579_005498 [Chaenotheca gracillima]|nr:MAG: hypothetical protein M4579_005498 [Chaenotheca gracillima]